MEERKPKFVGRRFRAEGYEMPQPALEPASNEQLRQIREVLDDMGIPGDYNTRKLWLDVVESQFAHIAHVINLGTFQEVKLQKIGTFLPLFGRVRDRDFKHAITHETVHGRELYSYRKSRSKKRSGNTKDLDKGQGPA